MTARDHGSVPATGLRDLPAVDQLLHQPAVARLLEDYPRDEVVRVVRETLDACRDGLRTGTPTDVSTPALALRIRERLYQRGRSSLRKVINATGIVLHTGLGRAPLPEEALDAIADAADGYCSLEFDLATGRRGSRHTHARELLRELTGAEDALVVNNNAAATFLALNTCAAGREVLISRGQLVEIGGSYRLPDIMAAAHCRMVEVGTTNRTHLTDYERAVGPETAAIIRVHTSNYRVVGFTTSPKLNELVDLARRHNLALIDDLGSGLLRHDLAWPEDEDEDAAPTPTEWDEPAVVDSIAAGADITLFSGDKLLGGPQAGVLVGRTALVDALRRNPLARAFRPGKLTLAALEATLRLYRDPERLAERIPVLRLLGRPLGMLRSTAEDLAQRIADQLPKADVAAEADDSEAGGGSLAAIPFPTWVVTVQTTHPAERVASELRNRETPIIGRIRDDCLVFDVRTLEANDIDEIPGALCEAVREVSEEC